MEHPEAMTYDHIALANKDSAELSCKCLNVLAHRNLNFDAALDLALSLVSIHALYPKTERAINKFNA